MAGPHARREGSRCAALLALALLLVIVAGCPPDDGSIPPTFPDLSPAPAPTAPPAEAREMVRVCVLLPSSGASEDAGAEMRRGMAIAQAEVAAQAWRKHAFEWVELDSKSTEAGAVAAWQRCFVDGFHVVVGPVDPAAITALLPVAAAHDAVLVLPRIGPAIPTVWGEQIVAVGPPSSDMGRVAARDAREGRALGRAAVLHTEGIFGETLRDSFVAQFETGGGKVLLSRELPLERPGAWRSAALEAGLAGADCLFVVGPHDVAEEVAGALNDDPLAASHAWFVDWAMFPPVATAAGEDGYKRTHWVNRLLPQGELAQTYLARYQAEPDYAAGDGYDAILVVANAVEAAASPAPFDIAASARALRGLPGAFGNGSMIETGGLVWEDSAGYRIFEPVVSEVSAHWVFEARPAGP